MLAPVSVGLKFGFLIVLYLFLLWVAWSALRDLRRGRGGVVRSDRAAPYDATGMYDAARRFRRAGRQRVRAAPARRTRPRTRDGQRV